jgi:hypothetical protein
MERSFKSSLMFIVVTLALIVSVLGVTPVFADDETPPPPATEVPVATEEPFATGPAIVIAEPAATEEPFLTEEPAATEALVLTEEPAVTEVPFMAATDEAASVADVLEQLPADTQVVVLDEAGSLEPLVTQEAAEIIQNGDPMWCPAGITPVPGVGGCTASFFSLQALLDYLAVDANEPTQAGVIWIAAEYDSSVNDPGVSSFILDGGTAFSTMSQYDLTIQGGWSGSNNAVVDHSNLSVFTGDSLGIQNWFGNVTINDIQLQGNTGLEVVTNGDVNVSNSTFANNTVNLNVSSAGGSVTLNGVTSFGSIDENAHVTAHSDVSISNSNFWWSNSSGVSTYGLSASSTNGSITLNGVTVEGIRGGAYLVADGGINVIDSVFRYNSLGSLHAYSTNGNIFINQSAFYANPTSDGAYLSTSGDVIVRCSEFSRNGLLLSPWRYPTFGYGLNAANVTGSLTLSSVILEENLLPGHAYTGNATINTVDCTLPYTPGEVAAEPASDQNRTLYYRIQQTEDQLPAILGEGNLFASAFKIILTSTGEKVRNLQIPLEFPIPEDMQNDNLAVLYWDGSIWVPVPGGRVVDGYFVITVTRPGFYVLVRE